MAWDDTAWDPMAWDLMAWELIVEDHIARTLFRRTKAKLNGGWNSHNGAEPYGLKKTQRGLEIEFGRGTLWLGSVWLGTLWLGTL